MAELRELQATARTLALEVVPSEISRAEDIAPAFEALKSRAQALCVVGDALVMTHRFESVPWRSPRDCRRFTISGSTSKREV